MSNPLTGRRQAILAALEGLAYRLGDSALFLIDDKLALSRKDGNDGTELANDLRDCVAHAPLIVITGNPRFKTHLLHPGDAAFGKPHSDYKAIAQLLGGWFGRTSLDRRQALLYDDDGKTYDWPAMCATMKQRTGVFVAEGVPAEVSRAGCILMNQRGDILDSWRRDSAKAAVYRMLLSRKNAIGLRTLFTATSLGSSYPRQRNDIDRATSDLRAALERTGYQLETESRMAPDGQTDLFYRVTGTTMGFGYCRPCLMDRVIDLPAIVAAPAPDQS